MARRFERQPPEDDDRRQAEQMAEDELSEGELLAEIAEALPDRAALSTLDADITIPVNPALAADVLAGEPPEETEDAESPADAE